MELSRVKGLGPAKVEALQAAGIMSAEDLASLDLRRRPDIEGIKADTLKEYKQRARQILQSEGVPFEKAPYATKSAASTRTPKPAAKKSTPNPSAPARRGWLRRLVRKA